MALLLAVYVRQFNKYTGSLDAVGALTNMKTAINAYKLLSSPMVPQKHGGRSL